MGETAARSQAEFLDGLRVAVDHLFAHRKVLRRVGVKFGFWPEGLVISATIPARNDAELDASRQAILSWVQLSTIDPAQLIAVIDRVCQPAHDLLGAKGSA